MSTVPSAPLRDAVLPDRDGSHAVLVGCSVGLEEWFHFRKPEEGARDLAHVLAGPEGAFRPEHVTVLLCPRSRQEVLDALRQAADAASDVLLFFYAGRGFLHGEELALGVMDTDPHDPARTGVDLDVVAQIMGTSRAARPAVVLDCDYAALATTRFTGHAPAASLLAAGRSSFTVMSDAFTKTLVRGLTHGVSQGPRTLDLETLQDAIYAAFASLRYSVENEYIPGPTRVLREGGQALALGINPGFGSHRDALPLNERVVDEQEGW